MRLHVKEGVKSHDFFFIGKKQFIYIKPKYKLAYVGECSIVSLLMCIL